MLVWLLYLAEHTHKVGIGKTSNYHTLAGSVEAYANRIGVSHFDCKRGYKGLVRVAFDSPLGKSPLFLADKPDLVRLTKPGIGVLSQLATRPQYASQIKSSIGARKETEIEWFPVNVKPDARVSLKTSSPRGVTEPYSIEVEAAFTCERCHGMVAHSYSMEWRTQEFDVITATCPGCSLVWQHFKGHPYSRPTPAA